MGNPMGVGLVSRIDFGSPGFRKGLLELAFDRFREAKVHFVVLAGGLISGRDMKRLAPRKKDEQSAFLDSVAEELSRTLPRMGKDDDIKIYVMVSPAYDGPMGAEVARRLAELRSDIRFYAKYAERFGKAGKKVAVLVPTKASWRADYASVPVDRLLRDELKRSSQLPADVYAVGCFGVFMHRPRGESPCTYIGLPALHKLEEVSVAENQVGIAILEVNDQIRATNVSFKDMVRDERKLVVAPTSLSDLERRVYEQLQAGPSTAGMIEDALHESRDRVSKALEKLMTIKRRNYPRIVKDEDSGRYDFDSAWFQNELRYPWDSKDLVEDRILGFGCMHGGSVHTDYAFIVDKLPELLVSEGITHVAGVGDFIEGLKHDLALRGEVIPGMNYSDHHVFAGELLSATLAKAFDTLLDRALKDGKPSSLTEVGTLVDRCLITFAYKRGNHDDWVIPLGFTPLVLFRLTLVARLVAHIMKSLADRGLQIPNDLYDRVSAQVVATDEIENTYKLPSALSVGYRHPHQGRAQTTTLRLQSALAAMRGCQVGLIANFHTAAAMTQWDPENGQRVGLQLGTLKTNSDFEYNMNKVLDFGVGCVRIRSRRGRIVETQTLFATEPTGKKYKGEEIRAYKKSLGIG